MSNSLSLADQGLEIKVVSTGRHFCVNTDTPHKRGGDEEGYEGGDDGESVGGVVGHEVGGLNIEERFDRLRWAG